MSKIFKASVTIATAFGFNKILAFTRQFLIAKQFGFSPEIDAFNVANNLPDLIFSIFSGAALAMAFIPVFSQYLNIKGNDHSWKLFSKVTSLLFVATGATSIVIWILAPILVSSEIGVAPGFTSSQQGLVVALLRINLIATIIFSMSGLVTASLQAHKHFLLPAVAPIFYNLGIIFGAVVLSPNMGIYGLTYGVVLGAAFHFLVQLPGLIKYKFRFSFSIDLKDKGIKKIFRLMLPRLLTVLLIQIIFLLRDNLASRLPPGSVTALTYGYFIMQVPETLIGSSIAIALLPSLSTFISEKRQEEFARVLSASIRILIAASLIPIVLVFTMLTPLVDLVFDFSPKDSQLLVLTTKAFMAGLLAHTLLEVSVRAFYAKQKAVIPLLATLVRTIAFIVLGYLFYKRAGAVGIAVIDSITVAIETGILLILLMPEIYQKIKIVHTFGRSIMGSLVGLVIIWATLTFLQVPQIVQVGIAAIVATGVYTLFVIKEVKILIKL